jgi:hypothetical protein
MLKRLFLVLPVLALFATPAHAAYISIDDSSFSKITITAGDFEFGFSVDGVLLTTGLFQSGTITLDDAGHSFSGSWIDPSGAPSSRMDILFALPGNPTFTTSGLESAYSSSRGIGTIAGTFGGYIDPSLYFFTSTPTFLQDGHTEFGSLPFLSASFRSETVPEPTTLVLVGSAGLALIRRRRRA